MIADPTLLYCGGRITLLLSEDASPAETFRLIDFSAGKSTRVGVINANPSFGPSLTGVATLSISHSESKENKGQLTDRVAIRLDVRRPSPIDTVENDVIAQATLTVSLPRNGFTQSEVLVIVKNLFMWLATGDSSPEVNADAPFTNLTRVFAGEP